MTTPWLTPDWPVNMMATAVIRGDAILDGILAGSKTYDKVVSDVPRPKPYIIFATDATTLGNLFGDKGRNVFSEWQIVAENKEVCNIIYNELMRLFDGTEHPLANHVMVRGSLTSSFGLDEEDHSGYRKICEYAVHALRS